MEVPVRLPALWARSPVLANINSSNPPPPLPSVVCLVSWRDRRYPINKPGYVKYCLITMSHDQKRYKMTLSRDQTDTIVD